MKISAKGRYALAAAIEIARQSKSNEPVPVASIAGELGISKIFLEQALSQLKRDRVIYAVKGSKGGYRLARGAESITALEILLSLESNLAEPADNTVAKDAPAIESALRELVFNKLDKTIEDCLSRISIQDLVDYSNMQCNEQSFMLHI